MILTEETHNGSNECTMETARAGNEEPIFGQAGTGNEVVATRFAVTGIPGQASGGGWQNANIGSQVGRLGNRVTNKVGPNVLLKVMAGDAITATTQYFYENAVVNTNQTTTLTNDIITSLIGSIAGSGSVTDPVRHGAPDISNELNSDGLFTNITEPDGTNASGNYAKAYLTVLFFDERFKYVEEGSTFLRVQDAGNSNASLFFASKVGPHQEFDIKNSNDPFLGFSKEALGGDRYAYYNDMLWQPQDFGNYNFGVAAKAFGLSLDFALKFAGAAQIIWGHNVDWGNLRGFGDPIRDSQMITLGYNRP